MGGMLSSITGWTFLNEPAYRWFLFVLMMTLFLIVMGAILRHM